MFGTDAGDDLAETLARHVDWLSKLDKNKASRELVMDVLGNAERRAVEGRFDEAVARLYRVLEAWAQYVLQSEYGITTGAVQRDQVPRPLQEQWWQGDDTKPKKIGLEDAYTLLREKGYPLGDAFVEIVHDGPKARGALAARNMSILAHGFEPVELNEYKNLRDATLALIGLDPSTLPEFPILKLVQ